MMKTISKFVVLAFLATLPNCEQQVSSNFRTANSDSPSTIPTSKSAAEAGEHEASSSPIPSADASASASSVLTNPSASPSTNVSPSTTLTPGASPSTSANNGDTQAPTPGDGGEITVTDITASSLNLGWAVASDNKTAPSQLQYIVYQSTSNNLDTVANAESHGNAVGGFIPDLEGKLVSDLSSSTDYYFAVIVKDAAGNKAIYTSVAASTLDVTSPVPGNSGVISSANITASSLSLTWTTGSDNLTPATSLEYIVYKSTLNNISTLSDAESNGTAVGSYSANVATKNLTGLISSKTYYFNIVVKDAAGNKAVYAFHAASTLDATPPVPANSGSVTTSAMTPYSMSLNWSKANDNLTVQANLQYLVYQSSSNNIPSVSGAEANGTALGAYTSDINSKAVTGLSPNTSYYFMVIVRDAAGNKSAYTMLNISSLPLPPTFYNRTHVYGAYSTAWTYSVAANNGALPLTYSLTTAPTGASINSSTGLVSYPIDGIGGDKSFTVHAVDAVGRTADQSFTLHIAGAGLTPCVWTGAAGTTMNLAANWIFCGGGVPGGLSVIIDGNAPNQPYVGSSMSVGWIASATSEAGGTITIGPGADFTITTYDISAGIRSDIKFQGATPTCTTCRLVNTTYVVNNATLTLGSGVTLTSGLSIGTIDFNATGNLVVNPGSSNPAEWPTVPGIGTGAISSNPSSIYIDGLNLQMPSSGWAIAIGAYSVVKKMDNINFVMPANTGTSSLYIGCNNSGGAVYEDTNWTGLDFSQVQRTNSNGFDDGPLFIGSGPCSSSITVSGTGRAYGLRSRSDSNFTFLNSTSATCTWTGAIDRSWSTPGNWSNCSNGRSNYPDQLDWVTIPATANQPLINGHQSTQGTAAGTGGGTITINANSSLYIASSKANPDNIISSISFAGGSAGCTTCIVIVRGSLYLGDGATLTLLPDIRVSMPNQSQIFVGESDGRSNRAAHLVVAGGSTPANYPVIYLDSLFSGGGWSGIWLDGKTGTNSTASIDGLVLSGLATTCTLNSLASATGLVLNDRFTLSKLDHFKVTSLSTGSTCGSVVHVTGCANSSIVTNWHDLSIVNDPAPKYAVYMDHASCSAISPISIDGQGAGYGSAGSNDPNARLTWQ